VMYLKVAMKSYCNPTSLQASACNSTLIADAGSD
jgi:hypothetical protein